MLGQVFVIFTVVEQIRCEANVKLPRYVIEPGVKPAIFGSYSYNLLTGDFDTHRNTTVSVTEEIANNTTSTLSSDNTFRKHASTASLNQFNWWTRSKLRRNYTKKFTTKIFKQTIKTL